jgi:hypothetical protein
MTTPWRSAARTKITRSLEETEMAKKRTMTRLALARRLQELALRIAAGKPVRVGGVSARVPERVLLEEELETRDGETELELEVSWPAPRRPAAKGARAAPRRSRAGAR